MACGLNAGLAQASGFALIEQSASGQGLSYAGAAANTEDASVMWFNAAGLTEIEGSQGIVGMHVILPKTKYTDTATGDSDTPSTTGLVPNIYWKGQYGNYALGFGLNVPYGQKLEYADDWTGKYHALKTDLKSVNLNANVARKLNESTSIGFGLNAMYVDLNMTQLTSPTTTGTIKANSWGYGYNIGLLSHPAANTRLGLAYRSEVVQNAQGTYNGTTDITSDVTLPATASLSISQGVSDKITLLADATWTNWKAYDELVIKTSLGTLSETNQNFKDSMRYSLGMIYDFSDKWKLRTGLAYDETPVPDAESRSPRTPDSNKTWASIGFNYKFSTAMSMDFGYSHLFTQKVGINKSTPTALVGEYETSVDILSAQLVWNY
ncbi:MAG: outer membrane protein transport protein [Gammaproteobacteria bacterium]|nr:outer membrane protein transport protein [Gammaproteobacteria bacterium]MBD3775514.1 outer membrane protein transport protein [Thiotrichales bacterium]